MSFIGPSAKSLRRYVRHFNYHYRFFTLLTLQGLEGKLFTPVALTIVFALSGSLILSLTVIPVIASYLLKEVSHEEPWLPRQLQKLYQPALLWCLAIAKKYLLAQVLCCLQRSLSLPR